MNSNLANIVADAVKAAWDEELHPRHPEGSPEGGKFAPKGGGGEDARRHVAATMDAAHKQAKSDACRNIAAELPKVQEAFAKAKGQALRNAVEELMAFTDEFLGTDGAYRLTSEAAWEGDAEIAKDILGGSGMRYAVYRSVGRESLAAMGKAAKSQKLDATWYEELPFRVRPITQNKAEALTFKEGLRVLRQAAKFAGGAKRP